MAAVRVAALAELRDGDLLRCTPGGRAVVLLRVGDAIRAYPDRCVHLGVPLSEGTLDGGVLTCSAHHYQYDACTGRGINPRNVALAALPVTVEGGAIYVDPAAAEEVRR